MVGKQGHSVWNKHSLKKISLLFYMWSLVLKKEKEKKHRRKRGRWPVPEDKEHIFCFIYEVLLSKTGRCKVNRGWTIWLEEHKWQRDTWSIIHFYCIKEIQPFLEVKINWTWLQRVKLWYITKLFTTRFWSIILPPRSGKDVAVGSKASRLSRQHPGKRCSWELTLSSFAEVLVSFA